MKDEQLLELIAKGDQNAFRTIYDLYYEGLVYFSYRFVQDQDSSREIVQEVFIHLWENCSRLKILSLKPYLYVAVKNKALNYKKREAKYHVLPEKEKKVDPFTSTTHDELLYQEVQEEIDRAIGQLPERCRDIFILSRTAGLSYNEIATELKISIKTVETQMGIALNRLRQALSHLLIFLLLIINTL